MFGNDTPPLGAAEIRSRVLGAVVPAPPKPGGMEADPLGVMLAGALNEVVAFGGEVIAPAELSAPAGLEGEVAAGLVKMNTAAAAATSVPPPTVIRSLLLDAGTTVLDAGVGSLGLCCVFGTLSTIAVAAPITAVPAAAFFAMGIRSTAIHRSLPNSAADLYRRLASRSSARSITASTSGGQLASGFISVNDFGLSVRRMIIDSCADSLGKGSLPVSMLNATSANE